MLNNTISTRHENMLVLFGGKKKITIKYLWQLFINIFRFATRETFSLIFIFCKFYKEKNKLNLFLSSFPFYIILGHRSMRTATNYFLLNLSIADLLMSSLNCMFNFIFMLNSDWPFGTIYCTINNFMANVTVSTSVFTLVAISFDR